MLRLELQQRGLADLIKGRDGVPDDPYLGRVAASTELGLVREIAIWWRAFQIETNCRLTSRVLKRLGLFDPVVSDYFKTSAISAFAEELSAGFLSFLSMHPDCLVRAVSQFELALSKVHAGSAEDFEVLWDRNPDLVFAALTNGGELPIPETGCLYRMQIAGRLPNRVACTREFNASSGFARERNALGV
jgi:hypothetical protein